MKKICAFFLMLLLIEDCLAENNIFRLDERPEPSFEVSEEAVIIFCYGVAFVKRTFQAEHVLYGMLTHPKIKWLSFSRHRM